MNKCWIKNRLAKEVGTAACLLAILVSLGGHWLVLQSFAWARMIADYSRQESVASAISMTFDGKHPCQLCLGIQKGKATEKKPDEQKPFAHMEGLLPVNSFSLRGVAEYPLVVPPCRAGTEWSSPPPTPPPRPA
jgi:hypothetical protein